MKIGRVSLWLGDIVAALTAIASAVGLFADAYARESVPWAAQGAGQDAVNLLVAVPALAFAGGYASRGSTAGVFVWLGTLLYIVYSYVLYTFFVHFGPWFPLYVGVLGLSFYTLVGALAHIDHASVERACASLTRIGAAMTILLLGGVLFAALELTDIGLAIVRGTAPSNVEELGLTVNPVHVLDLAFVLPGSIITAILLGRRHALGLLFAVPLLVFFAVMGLAVSAMILMMRARGVAASANVIALFTTIVVAAVFASYRFLTGAADAPDVAAVS